MRTVSTHDILSIRDLRTYYYTDRGVVRAVDGINLNLKRGEAIGLVGESGCGKSTVALSMLRLVKSPGRIVGGEILFKGENLLEKSEEEIRKVRGREISMVFQDPTSSLNPVLTVKDQIGEVTKLHQEVKKSEVNEKIAEILRKVNIPDIKKVMSSYPHTLSGGMKQRVMIAMAVSCRPKILIADEPTSSLDVTIQAQILDLMRDLIKKLGLSLLLITHDLGVVAEMCDTVFVMYAGKIVERSDVTTLFTKNRHPYTRALLRSLPEPDVKRLESIPGRVPDLVNPPPGCRFQPRCRYFIDICGKQEPQPIEIETGHLVSCLNIDNLDY